MENNAIKKDIVMVIDENTPKESYFRITAPRQKIITCTCCRKGKPIYTEDWYCDQCYNKLKETREDISGIIEKYLKKEPENG